MRALFGATVLARQRAWQVANMPFEATISAYTRQDTGGGGSRKVLAVLADGVKCRLGTPLPSADTRADQEADTSLVDVFVPLGTPIPADGVIEVRGTDQAAGAFSQTLKIVATDVIRTNATRIRLSCRPLVPATESGER